jgi:hypothetical protein
MELDEGAKPNHGARQSYMIAAGFDTFCGSETPIFHYAGDGDFL